MPNQPQESLILVTGATGRQGGATTRHLLTKGFRVRALTRDPSKAEARALTNQGAEVIQGDLDDLNSLGRALHGVDGVFSVQNFWEAGFDREVRQGVALADAAKTAGIKHIVYSSVGSANDHTGISHFESKAKVEKHIRGLGLPHTILRPAAFMDDWQDERESILTGTLASPLDPNRPLHQIATDDIGAFAALVFSERDVWLGRELDIAGDAPTMPEMADIFSRVAGRPVRYIQTPWEAFEQAAGEEFTVMFRWFNDVGYSIDVTALRRTYPFLTDLETHLRKRGWASNHKREEGAGPIDET